MIKLNILSDEELQGVLKVFASSLLPHQNYSPDFFSQNLNSVFKYIRLEEMHMEYFVIFEALFNLNKIKMSFVDFSPRLTRDTFDTMLQVSVNETVVRPEVRIQEWLLFESMPDNLNTATTRELACQKLYQRCMELYDECFAMAIDSSEAMNHEVELRAAFTSLVSVQSISDQSMIMQHSLRVGRRVYRGAADWLEYTQHSVAEISSRLQEAKDSARVTLDNVGVSAEMLRSLQELSEPIAEYGIPQLDDATPIMKHRLVVVVGAENVGKTKFAVDKATNVLLAGGKVAYMCGESVKAQVYADILINYMWKKYHIILQHRHLADLELCTPEVQKIIGMSIDEVVHNGALTLREAYGYKTLYHELEEDYQAAKFDMVVIDHSFALTGGNGMDMRERIDTLAISCRDFKKAYPVCVLVTSHPSVYGKEDIRRGRKVATSSTKGSQTLAGEADEVFVLRDNETLQKQGLIVMDNSKRRDAPVVIEPIVLKKRFEVSALVYDEAYQAPEAAEELEKEEALRLLSSDLDEYTLTD